MLKNTYECIKTYLSTFCRADLVRKICMQYCNKLFPPTKELDQGQRLNAHAVFFFFILSSAIFLLSVTSKVVKLPPYFFRIFS